MSTVYCIGIKEGEFLMIFNPRRGGWEMPGGRIEDGESISQAAVREFSEESGLELDVVACRPIHDSNVCLGHVGREIAEGEMEYRFFSSLPSPLAFPREEYLEVLEWAYSLMGLEQPL